MRLDGTTLCVADVAAVAAGASATLAPEARERMEQSYHWFEKRGNTEIVRQKWAWIGGSASGDMTTQTFIEGHCAGVGEPLGREYVRAVMLCRANTLAVGHSAVRPRAVEVLLEMLAADVVPVVPAQGAVGAAGSCALAHIARVVCGFGGEAYRDGRRLPVARAMIGIEPLDPTEKEALSLINGSTLTTALGALVCARADRALFAAEAACAMTMEAVRADLGSLSRLAMEARHHPGGKVVALRLRRLVEGSELVNARRDVDSFSIRCAPAVLGAARDALEYVTTVVERELNAAADNPLVFPGAGVVEAGNFHGAPVALVLDHLKVALTSVASISERRTFRLTYAKLSGLPSFLLLNSGVNSGLMLAQYTAASLVSECKGLSHPGSVDSIPTVQHHEDHVSMGPVVARSALEVVDLLADVIAIELLCGAQGLDFRICGESVDEEGKLVQVPKRRPGAGTLEIHRRVRAHVTRWDDDRVMHPDLAVLGRAVRDGAFDPSYDCSG
jgi:histidine ammonia-lyase